MPPSEIFAYKKPDNVRGPRSTISLKRSTHIRQRSTRRPADYPIYYSNNDRILRRSERSDVPIATDAPQQTVSLFDHLVGGHEQRGRNCEAERLGDFEIDHQLVFGRRLHRQVGGLVALENSAGIIARQAVTRQD